MALKCPVCKKPLKNKGGLASHVRNSKDTAHAAYRNEQAKQTHEAPKEQVQEAPPKEAVDPTPEAPKEQVPEGPPKEAVDPTPEAPKEPPKKAVDPAPPEGVQEEAPAQQEGGAPVLVAWAPPETVTPLAQKKEDAQQEVVRGDGKKHTVSNVPLEPFLAASLATICNGFLDPDKGDKPVTEQEVGNTGMPAALEHSVRYYWPDLPLDHPAVLLTISGTALVALVKSKKAKRPKDGQEAPKEADGDVQVRPPPEEPLEEPQDEPEEEEDYGYEALASNSNEGAQWAAMLAGGGVTQ